MSFDHCDKNGECVECPAYADAEAMGPAGSCFFVFLMKDCGIAQRIRTEKSNKLFLYLALPDRKKQRKEEARRKGKKG